MVVAVGVFAALNSSNARDFHASFGLAACAAVLAFITGCFVVKSSTVVVVVKAKTKGSKAKTRGSNVKLKSMRRTGHQHRPYRISTHMG